MDQKQEARLLAKRFGFKTAPVLAWMQARKIVSITDLMHLWPNLSHTEAMTAARDDIEAFTFAT